MTQLERGRSAGSVQRKISSAGPAKALKGGLKSTIFWIGAPQRQMLTGWCKMIEWNQSEHTFLPEVLCLSSICDEPCNCIKTTNCGTKFLVSYSGFTVFPSCRAKHGNVTKGLVQISVKLWPRLQNHRGHGSAHPYELTQRPGSKLEPARPTRFKLSGLSMVKPGSVHSSRGLQ